MTRRRRHKSTISFFRWASKSWRVAITAVLVLAWVCPGVWAVEDPQPVVASSPQECENPAVEKVTVNSSGIRMVTREELATKTGVDGREMWLSILGEVYDVTKGTDHYAPGRSYSRLVGCDGTVPFVTGKFTLEEADKSADELEDAELPGLADWRDFYRTHKVYKYIGKFLDPRYYDEDGKPTPDMIKLEARIHEAREEQNRKAELRRQERLKRKLEAAAKAKARPQTAS